MALEWPSLLRTADEWIITYALPYELFHVQLFAIGHAVELYLKVANAKITGDMDRAVKFGHSIPRLLSDCKNHDSSFMIGYELRDSVLAVDMMNQNTWSKLSREDYLHLGNHQELYFVAQYLPDLKYLGGPLKNRKNNGPS